MSATPASPSLAQSESTLSLTWIFGRLRARWRPAAAFAIAFQLLQVTIFAPLGGLLLRMFLQRWGRASVGNFEIVSFLASPPGVVALLTLGGLFVAARYFEVSGLLRILGSERLPWWNALWSSTGLLPRLARLGVKQVAVYLVLAVPFLAGIGLTYWLLWSGNDLNSLIILRPPHFWQGAIVAGVLLSIYFALVLVLFSRWLYAVPILCLEPGRSPAEALRESARRSRGMFVQSIGVLLSWLLITMAVNFVMLFVTQFLLSRLLGGGEASLTRACAIGAVVLLVHAAVSGGLSIASSLSFAAVVLALYHCVSPESTFATAPELDSPATASERRSAWLWASAIGVLALLALIAGPGAISDLPLIDRVELTAHRAGAKHGPENTLTALRAAIADGAEWAEIDVQLTADGQLAVLHDTDLARIGGGNRRVADVMLAELQALDAGTTINPNFSAEQVPTLHAMLAAAKGKIRLNVELKPHSAAGVKPLTEQVVQAIQEAEMVGQCRICSQSYEGIQRARELEPRIPIGFIVASAVGDPARLPVDFLMIRATLATPSFVDRAHAARVRVHVWTINDPRSVPPLLDAGVDNLITDDVPAIRAKLQEVAELPPVQRLLLRVRHLISQ